MKKIPRKLKKKIPKGVYCYTPIFIKNKNNLNNFEYPIKLCSFYTNILINKISKNEIPNWMDQEYINEFGKEKISWCNKIKIDITDQCKSCGFNYGNMNRKFGKGIKIKRKKLLNVSKCIL